MGIGGLKGLQWFPYADIITCSCKLIFSTFETSHPSCSTSSVIPQVTSQEAAGLILYCLAAWPFISARCWVLTWGWEWEGNSDVVAFYTHYANTKIQDAEDLKLSASAGVHFQLCHWFTVLSWPKHFAFLCPSSAICKARIILCIRMSLVFTTSLTI